MTDFTAEDLKNELEADGLRLNGVKHSHFDIREAWWEGSVGDVLNTLALGDFEIVETVVGKSGNITHSDVDNVWENYIILKQGNRYFRLPGEYDSWDAKGWSGEVEEVKKTTKTIEVWE